MVAVEERCKRDIGEVRERYRRDVKDRYGKDLETLCGMYGRGRYGRSWE